MDYFVYSALLVATVLFVLLLTVLISFCRKTKKDAKRSKQSGTVRKSIGKEKTLSGTSGFDKFGYDLEGFNREGYNRLGRNRKNQYNRLFDTTSQDAEGFYNPNYYPIFVTPHAEKRFRERLDIADYRKMRMLALDAYRFGKSKRQIKKTSAYLVEEIEEKYDNSIVLIYRNVIYIFTPDNVLKTLYKNDKITL